MRRTRLPRQSASMPARDHARLTIDFDLRGSHIAGVVHDEGGHGVPFEGWMALTRTIERALDTGQPGRFTNAGKDFDAQEKGQRAHP